MLASGSTPEQDGTATGPTSATSPDEQLHSRSSSFNNNNGGPSKSRIQHFEAPVRAHPPVYRRRFSDMTVPQRETQATLEGVQEYSAATGQRKSLDGAEPRREKPGDGDGLPDVVLEAMRLRGMRAAAALATETAADSKGKRYNEMMERFQIRRVTRTPSAASGVGGGGTSSIHTARDTVDRPTSVASQHEQLHSTHSAYFAAPHVPPLPSLSIPGDRSFMTEMDHAAMTPRRGSIEIPVLSKTMTRSGRFSLYWLLISWRRRLTRELVYVAENVAKPISPASTFSRVRLVVLMLAFTVHVVIFPLETAFFPANNSIKDVGATIEVAIELVLVLDFALMFNTAFFNKRNVLVTSRKAIAKHYLRSWFVVDLISSVPVDLILVLNKDDSLEGRWMRLAYDVAVRSQRVVHVLRVARYMWTLLLDSPERSMFEWLLYSRYSHLFRIAWIILFIILIAHYLACGWKLLAIASVGGLSSDAETNGRTPLEEYVANFYDVLQLLQGQGVATTTVGQNIYATIAILMGSIALAIIFGHVAILVSNFNANSTNYQRKMESVFAIMSKLQLPAPLRERIHQYYEHLWREYESLDGEIVSFAKGLSHTLELEVVLFKYMDLIMHVPFWSSGSPDFQKQLMLHLSVRVYLPDDFIIRRGEVGEEFFMINRGVCELVLGPDSFECTTDALPDEDPDSSFSDGGERADEEGEDEMGGAPKTARFELPTARKGEDAEAVANAKRGRRGSRSHLYATPGDNVVNKHAAGTSSNSLVASKYIQKLRRGQSFGELALFMNYERTANVRALTYVEMCVLQRRDFQKILVKHPRDRKQVLTAMLTKTMENNEATKVWCPLKATVQSVFGGGSSGGTESGAAAGSGGSGGGDGGLSAMHAALLISSAVNVPLDDASIQFGIGVRLREQLVELRDTQRRNAETAAAPTTTCGPTSSGVSPTSNASATTDGRKQQPGEENAPTFSVVTSDSGDMQRLAGHVQQLEHVQSHMATTLIELTRELHALRSTNERLQLLVGAYESRLVELSLPSSRDYGMMPSLSTSDAGAMGAAAGTDPSEHHRSGRRASRVEVRAAQVEKHQHPQRPRVVPYFRQRSASLSSINTARGGHTHTAMQLDGQTSPLPRYVGESTTDLDANVATTTTSPHDGYRDRYRVNGGATHSRPVRRASIGVVRSLSTRASLWGSQLTGSVSTKAKNKPSHDNPHHPQQQHHPHQLGSLEGAARSAFHSMRALLTTSESAASLSASPTMYADQLFEQGKHRDK